jgi:hypothetical protein
MSIFIDSVDAIATKRLFSVYGFTQSHISAAKATAVSGGSRFEYFAEFRGMYLMILRQTCEIASCVSEKNNTDMQLCSIFKILYKVI